MPINKLDNTWAIDGNLIYTPHANVKVEHTNLAGSSSGRTEDGMMHIDWIRRDLTKVTIHYNAMTGDELDYMFSLTQGREYVATIEDRGRVRDIYAYTGDFSYEHYTNSLHKREGGMYTGVTFDIVEM